MDDLSVFKSSNLLHLEERMARYCPGGFHPVCLGDTFNERRYQIHHKIGWGGFSTVWLAWDEQDEQWVSIKIMDAASSNQSQELATIRSLQEKSASDHIVELLDSFSHQGPNGIHQCLVFEMLGPSLDKVVADYGTLGDRLEPEIILKISRQILQAVSSLHEAGYAHGAISCHNYPKTRFFQEIGIPECEDLIRLDGNPIESGMPKQLVKAVGWVDWLDEDDEDIRLLDFGEAFAHGDEPSKLAQPSGLETPETIFTDQFDYRVDLWRVGCTLYTMLFAVRPFQPFGKIDYVVLQMIDFVEELPKEWEPKLALIKKDSSLRWDRVLGMSSSPVQLYLASDWIVWLIFLPDCHEEQLEQKFHDRIQDPKLTKFLPVIQGLMRFRPSDRIEASEALRMLDSIS